MALEGETHSSTKEMPRKRRRENFERDDENGGLLPIMAKKRTAKSTQSSGEDSEACQEGIPPKRHKDSSLFNQSVERLKDAYISACLEGRSEFKAGNRWFGKVWDPEKFQMSPLTCQYTGYVSDSVLHNWRRLNRKDTVPDVEPCAGAYNEVITRLCDSILKFGPLPRSRPVYKIYAAKHPVGVVLHGQELATGEMLQLIAKTKRNTPIWRFVATCLRKLLVLAEEERDKVKNYNPSASLPEWNEFLESIHKTVLQLRKRGVAKYYLLERMTPKHIEEILKHVEKTLTNDDLKAIIGDIRCVFCERLPKAHSVGDASHHGQYMVHVPHEFEFYLKNKVEEKVNEKYGERFTVNKEKFLFPRRPGRIHPDIVIRDKNTKRIVACIDAKLKTSYSPEKNDEYQMLTYVVGLEADNEIHERGGKVKGVVFVAVYKEPYVDTKEDTGPDIRFIFCGVNKANDDAEIESGMNKKVEAAVDFLLRQAGG